VRAAAGMCGPNGSRATVAPDLISPHAAARDCKLLRASLSNPIVRPAVHQIASGVVVDCPKQSTGATPRLDDARADHPETQSPQREMVSDGHPGSLPRTAAREKIHLTERPAVMPSVRQGHGSDGFRQGCGLNCRYARRLAAASLRSGIMEHSRHATSRIGGDSYAHQKHGAALNSRRARAL
jgi:hypothetical protein